MKNEKLSPQNERLIIDFVYDLALIDGPDDMFPPDDGLVSEPREPILPKGDIGEALCLAAVYDLIVYRRKKTEQLL